MSSADSLTLVCLVDIKRSAFPPGVNLTTLPELVDEAIVRVAPRALDPKGYYLVAGGYEDLRHGVNQLAVPYHQYAVEECGERCTLAQCEDHAGLAPVVKLFGRQT